MKTATTPVSSRVSKPITTLKVSAGNARHVVEDESTDGEERSRSNSSTTLMPGSNSQSQTNGHDVVESHFRKTRRTKLPTTQALTKSEGTAFSELNVLSRRYFLAYLSNTFADEPVCAIFPGMRSDHAVYKEAKYRVQRSYKTWKGEVLKAALQWVQRWIKSARGEARQTLLSEMATFADLKAEIRKEYDHSWLESVFRFGIEAVDFGRITPDGLRFLKCMRLPFCSHLPKPSAKAPLINVLLPRRLSAACHAFPYDGVAPSESHTTIAR